MVAQSLLSPDELSGLASVLARQYVKIVDYYYREWQKPLDAAAREARAPISDELAFVAGDYKQVSFWHLGRLLETNPTAALATWSEIKRLADEEWQSGNRTASVLGTDNDPWTRAQYLMIRQSMIADWQPSGAVEISLLDMLAASFFQWQQWVERATLWNALDEVQTRRVRRTDAPEEPPRLTTVEAQQHASDMADRHNRIYLRTLRALRDLRRYAGSVTINNPQQVNLAGVQQVNGAAPIRSDDEV